MVDIHGQFWHVALPVKGFKGMKDELILSSLSGNIQQDLSRGCGTNMVKCLWPQFNIDTSRMGLYS
jgi:hypothetical protein